MWLIQSTCFCLFFFFFQAEDGIRDDLVTGVQTCALPIFLASNSMLPCMHAALGFALLGGHNVAGGEDEFRTELRHSPSCSLARIGLARVAFEKGQLKKALGLLGEVRNAASIARFWDGMTSERIDNLLQQLKEEKSELALFLVAAIQDDGNGVHNSHDHPCAGLSERDLS